MGAEPATEPRPVRVQLGQPVRPGHHLDTNGPIALDRPDTAIRAIAFIVDPELGTIDTPHGRLVFLQAVGITLAEFQALQTWDAIRLLDALRPALPLYLTNLDRPSLTEDPTVGAAIAEGIRRDGSSTADMFVADVRWVRADGRTVVTLGANAVPGVAQVLGSRLSHGRALTVNGAEAGVTFAPGDAFAITENDDYLTVTLPPPVATELSSVLEPVGGVHALTTAPDLTIEIVRSQIRDQAGNVVHEVG